MRNTLSDLNNHLFEQLERLNDESLTNEELEREIERTDAMASVSSMIIQNASLAYKVMVHKAEYGLDSKDRAMLPEMLRDE